MAEIVERLDDVLAEMRSAFDGDDVARKNRGLRWGSDAITRLQSALTAMERERDEARARVVMLRTTFETIARYAEKRSGWWARETAREVLAETGDMAGMVVVSKQRLDDALQCLIDHDFEPGEDPRIGDLVQSLARSSAFASIFPAPLTETVMADPIIEAMDNAVPRCGCPGCDSNAAKWNRRRLQAALETAGVKRMRIGAIAVPDGAIDALWRAAYGGDQ